ncbi:MAG: hypothetical protein WC533_00405 [Candidatus Pacearchaeota archaeon]
MAQKITRRDFAKGLVGLVGLGSLVGCATGSNTSLLGTGVNLLVPGAKTFKQAQALSTIGTGLQAAGSTQALENSGTKVNIYNGGNQGQYAQPSQPRQLDYVAFNCDGKRFEYWGEIKWRRPDKMSVYVMQELEDGKPTKFRGYSTIRTGWITQLIDS